MDDLDGNAAFYERPLRVKDFDNFDPGDLEKPARDAWRKPRATLERAKTDVLIERADLGPRAHTLIRAGEVIPRALAGLPRQTVGADDATPPEPQDLPRRPVHAEGAPRRAARRPRDQKGLVTPS